VKRIALGSRDRRALLLGGAVVMATWIATRGMSSLLHRHEELRARAEVALVELQRSRELVAEEPLALEALADRARELVAWAPRLVAGATPAEALAELSSYMSGLAAQHRVRLVRLDPSADSASGPFARLSLRLEAQGDIRGLAGWLVAMEEGERLLAVREIALSAPEPAAPSAQPEVLRAEIVIEGWAAPQERGRE
jgi:hypothetical protein